MTDREYKQELLKVFSTNVDKKDFNEKMKFIEDVLIDFQAAKENEEYRDCTNKGNSWTDDELEIVLRDAPTKYNCMKYARLLHRGYGSIEQIYRWAASTDKEVKEKGEDAFRKQIRRIAKKISWRA